MHHVGLPSFLQFFLTTFCSKCHAIPPFARFRRIRSAAPVRLLHPSTQTFGRWDVRRGLSVGWGVESQFVLAASPLRFFSFRPCSLCSFHDPVFTYLCWGATLRERSPRARVAWEALVSESFQSSSSQNDSTRPQHSLLNSDRETRKNGTSMKIFSGSTEH